jgi:hypothetical protein
MQVLLATLVRGYTWQLCVPQGGLRWRHFPMPAPCGGMPARFSRRGPGDAL